MAKILVETLSMPKLLLAVELDSPVVNYIKLGDNSDVSHTL